MVIIAEGKGKKCDEGDLCVAGVCVKSECEVEDEKKCAGNCTNFGTDRNNCGGCVVEGAGKKCEAGEDCLSGECIELKADRLVVDVDDDIVCAILDHEERVMCWGKSHDLPKGVQSVSDLIVNSLFSVARFPGRQGRSVGWEYHVEEV